MPFVDVDTTENREFYSHWYCPHTKWPSLKKIWCRLNNHYSFDKERLCREVLEIKKTLGFRPFPIDGDKKRWTYQGIGLTARKGASEPLYDALHLFDKGGEINIARTFKKMANGVVSKEAPRLYEKFFTEKTAAYRGYMADVIEKFKSPKSKIRIIELKRKGVITPHVDFPYYKQIRLHTVLQTNNDVWWECDGVRFQIPSDGHWYWFDTGKYHSVWNDGKEDRIILSLNLSLYEELDESPRYRGKTFEELIKSRDL